VRYAHAIAITATIAFCVVAVLGMCMTKPLTQAIVRAVFWTLFGVMFGVTMLLVILSYIGQL
jgi:hypothetical protein